MRIGIEAQRLFREKKHGMDFVALELIKALQVVDQVNEYFIFVNKGSDRCLKETPNFRIIEFSGWYPVWEQFKLPRKCHELGIEVLHCTSNLAPLYMRVPVIVTIHDIIYLEGLMLLGRGFTLYQRFGNMYRKLLAPAIFRKAKKIVTVSYSERKRLLKLPWIEPSKIEVVYNSVGSHFKQTCNEEAKESAKRKYDLPEKFILFLGNTDPKKNTSNTILAFLKYSERSSTDLKLVVGDTDRTRLNRLLSEYDKLHLKDRITLTGYINNQDMPAVVAQAKLFLYPSKRESFGIPILEAMSQGVPVITSCAYAMPEVAGNAAELIDPESVDSIANGIEKIIEDDELRNQLIENGKQRLKQFDWQKSASQILDIYIQQRN